MRPVHAGLLGEDTLILLDEAHLSEPFRQTLDNVRTIGKAHMRTVVLTATPGEQPERPLRLQPEDYRDRTLRGRVEAAKPVRLMRQIQSSDPAPAFARAARDMADRLRRGGVSAPAVAVVVNRVDLARAVFEKLHESEPNCLLMIGRSRAVDRDRIVTALEPYRTGAARAEAGPLMVVATQCLEVGVDLDLDGMVTQAASLDALRQRFGRLNRAGRDIAAEGAILVTAESLAKRFDDPVYGDRIRRTWDALTSIAVKGQVDFGFQALDQSLQDAALDVDELAAKRARAPVLMPAYLDLWSQTSPVPAADPDVGLFLHGSERVSPEVSIAWRGDITAGDLADEGGAEKLEAILELMPPRSAEMVEVPIWAAEAWLRRWNTASAARIADVAERENDLEVELSGTNRRAFRWAGANDPRTGLVNARDLRAGDVLVVPADYGGCDSFGWAPRSREYVSDVADEAAWPYRGRRHAVRITPEVAHWDRLAATLAGTDELDLDGLLAAIPAAPGDDTPEDRPRRDVRAQIKALQQTRGGVSRITVHRPYEPARGGAILVAPRGIDGVRRGGQPVTEHDALSHAASGPVPLEEHTDGVVEFVERFADTLKLDPSVAGDLRLAASLHDEGKADERFQLFLSGGDWWNRPDGPILGKSGRPTSRAAWYRAELPKGWRHEALSVQMATADPRFRDAHDPLLVLWLIGTHHGLGRPFFGFSDPLADGIGPQSLAYSFEGLDWASVFVRLRQCYGTWGLARLEAILRLADHRASEAAKP